MCMLQTNNSLYEGQEEIRIGGGGQGELCFFFCNVYFL